MKTEAVSFGTSKGSDPSQAWLDLSGLLDCDGFSFLN
jgi:hypothetical protein